MTDGSVCTVCAAGGLSTPARYCAHVDGGCIVTREEHQHLCAQHWHSCEPLGPDGARMPGPCFEGHDAESNYETRRSDSVSVAETSLDWW